MKRLEWKVFGVAVLLATTTSAQVTQRVSTRWYAVYYGDAIVLGGCSATSTFNLTQEREVLWLP